MGLKSIIKKEFCKIELDEKPKIRKVPNYPKYNKKDFDEIHVSFNKCRIEFRYSKLKKKLFIDLIDINEEIRKKGFGRKAVEALERIAYRLGCKYIEVVDSVADGFWKEMNFVPYKEDFIKYL